MSGTPVLSALTEGLAGTVPVALRGVLNATANVILSKMADGTSYEDALARRSAPAWPSGTRPPTSRAMTPPRR